jgi:hypothetical protein
MDGAGAGGLAGVLRNPFGLIQRFLPQLGFLFLAREMMPVIGGLYQDTFGDIQKFRSLGRISGQGVEAGLRETTQGMSSLVRPFQAVGFREAREIVTGVRQAGFSGTQANQIDEAVAGTINRIGTSVESTIQLFATSMRQGQESIGQVTQEMTHFNQQAHNTGMSIQSFTDAIQGMGNTFRGLGVGPQANQLAVNVATMFPASAGFDPQQMGQFMAEHVQMLGALQGMAPWQVASNPKALQSGMDRYIDQFLPMAQQVAGNNVNAQAAFLSQTPMFQGLPANVIRSMIQRRQQGYTFNRLGALEQARGTEELGTHEADLRAIAELSRRGGQDAQLAKHLADLAHNKKWGQIEQQLRTYRAQPAAQIYSAQEQDFKQRRDQLRLQVQEAKRTGDLPLAEGYQKQLDALVPPRPQTAGAPLTDYSKNVEASRRQAVQEALRAHAINQQQASELLKHVGDTRTTKFSDIFRNIESEAGLYTRQGAQRGDTVTVGNVTITLDPKLKQFRLYTSGDQQSRAQDYGAAYKNRRTGANRVPPGSTG